MQLSFFKNPAVRFVFNCFALYVLWYGLYEIWLHPTRILDRPVVNSIVFLSEKFLSSIGYQMVDFGRIDSSISAIGIDTTHGVQIGDPCNGIAIFALFAGFIIAFPGKWVRKLYYIPFGISIIYTANLIRIIVLCLIAYYAPEQLEFNHNYTFTTLVYSVVILLWYYWIKKLSSFNNT